MISFLVSNCLLQSHEHSFLFHCIHKTSHRSGALYFLVTTSRPSLSVQLPSQHRGVGTAVFALRLCPWCWNTLLMALLSTGRPPDLQHKHRRLVLPALFWRSLCTPSVILYEYLTSDAFAVVLLPGREHTRSLL